MVGSVLTQLSVPERPSLFVNVPVTAVHAALKVKISLKLRQSLDPL